MAADPHQTAPEAAPQDETAELARKLLDLWQDHLSALAQDPTLLGQALKLMAAYSPLPWPQPGMSPTGGAGFAPFPNQFPGGPFAPGFPFGVPAAAPRPAPAAAAPDAGAGSVGELRRRLAELEGRLAELERSGGGPKSARKRAARKGNAGPRARAAKGG
jgi:hypothetical protein